MYISISYDQDAVPVTVFHISGEINATAYEQLQQAARQAIDGGTHSLVLDLADVSYVSSAGIRALNYIFHALRTSAPEDSDEIMRRGLKAGTYRSPHLKLARPTPRVKDILCLAGVDTFIEIHDTLHAAVASFTLRTA